MNLLSFFQRKASAPVARDRLQLLLAYERSQNGRPDITAVLQQEILAVIAKHFPIDPDKVQVKLDHGSGVSTLEIDIEMPSLDKTVLDKTALDKGALDKGALDKAGSAPPVLRAG